VAGLGTAPLRLAEMSTAPYGRFICRGGVIDVRQHSKRTGVNWRIADPLDIIEDLIFRLKGEEASPHHVRKVVDAR
jgi:hypothetical protein